MAEGLEDYCSRCRLDCPWVGKNTDWAHNAGRRPPQKDDWVQYRRPRRGRQRRPWLERPGASARANQ
eukprot:11194712-Lingulodinium_polyedra.AAC.1